jgi:hypothetical protein
MSILERRTQMEAEQTDVENPQLTSQEDGTVDGIAGGIMDMLDGDPNQSANLEPKEVKTEPESKETEEVETYTIKWQGQEKEVTQEELLDLAQKGFDYTKKTQDLALERDNLAPYVGLANRIKADPVLATKIADIIAGKQPEPPPLEKKFDDPIDQLKWEIKQEALADARKEIQLAAEPMQRMQALNAIKAEIQRDPDYEVVHQQIIDMVASQPPSIQKTLYLQLDQDPNAYMEAFQHFKNQVPKATPVPKPLKTQTHAPILESGGVTAPEGIESKAKIERISKMKAKALRSGDPTSVADWLKASGAIDHLY